MKKNRPVVLTICSPEASLGEKYSTIVLKPSIGEIPLGVLYLASELDRYNFDVVVIDNSIERLNEDDLVNKMVSLDPLLVGFSISVLNVEKSIVISKQIKRISPDTPIVYGGPNVTIMPEKHAALDCVDIIITKQGEITLRKLVQSMADRSYVRPQSIKQKILFGKAPESLDDLAYPDRKKVNINKYSRKGTAMAAYPTDFMCSSRGCPHKCAFCSSKTVWNRKYFTRTPGSIVDEIVFLMENYGSKGVYFREDNFTVSENRVLSICNELINRKISIQWECESRVDALSKKTLEMMKEAGCSGIWCGVESGSQRILDYIRKGYKVEDVINFYNWCKELDIHTSACFMLGFPIETAEDIKKSFELASGLSTQYSHFATYVGFPGSEIYDTVIKQSLMEDRWGDILMPRSNYFSFCDLCALETTMTKYLKAPDKHHIFYDLLRDICSNNRSWKG